MSASVQLSNPNPALAAAVPGLFGGGRPVILQVIPALVTGGAERGCVDMAAAIQKVGGTAIVVSEGGPMTHELTRHGVRHITMSVASKNPWTIWRNAARLSKLMREENIDLVHVRSRAPAWSAYLACRRLRTPLVTTFHAAYAAGSRLKRWYNSVMARGDRIIAVSTFVYNHVGAVYAVEPERLRLIHRGVDTELLAPDKVTQARLAKLIGQWRLPEDQRIILLPGRLTRWKGHRVLLEALARLPRQDARVVFAGDDQGRVSYRRELEVLIDKLGLSGRVSIVGHCDDMPAAYMLADVVVNASTEPEAFGRVVAEAQAMGRPVIVSDLGAAHETVIPGTTGLIVPPGDPERLAEAIEAALALDPLQRQAVGMDAMAHARKHFGKSAMCAATLAVYGELLAPSSAAGL
jgi:glycosyltransferase involved in cell wall biosynthesis